MIPNTTTRRTKAKNILVFLYNQANKMVLGSVFFLGQKIYFFPIQKNHSAFYVVCVNKTEMEWKLKVYRIK